MNLKDDEVINDKQYLDKCCWTPKSPVKRTILILLDALRFDFVHNDNKKTDTKKLYKNILNVFQKTQKLYKNRTRFYK